MVRASFASALVVLVPFCLICRHQRALRSTISPTASTETGLHSKNCERSPASFARSRISFGRMFLPLPASTESGGLTSQTPAATAKASSTVVFPAPLSPTSKVNRGFNSRRFSSKHLKFRMRMRSILTMSISITSSGYGHTARIMPMIADREHPVLQRRLAPGYPIARCASHRVFESRRRRGTPWPGTRPSSTSPTTATGWATTVSPQRNAGTRPSSPSVSDRVELVVVALDVADNPVEPVAQGVRATARSRAGSAPRCRGRTCTPGRCRRSPPPAPPSANPRLERSPPHPAETSRTRPAASVSSMCGQRPSTSDTMSRPRAYWPRSRATTSSPRSSAVIAARCTNTVAPVLKHSERIGPRLGETARRDHPSDAPAGHRPRLGESVHDDDWIVVPGRRSGTTARRRRRTRCGGRPRPRSAGCSAPGTARAARSAAPPASPSRWGCRGC